MVNFSIRHTEIRLYIVIVLLIVFLIDLSILGVDWETFYISNEMIVDFYEWCLCWFALVCVLYAELTLFMFVYFIDLPLFMLIGPCLCCLLCWFALVCVGLFGWFSLVCVVYVELPLFVSVYFVYLPLFVLFICWFALVCVGSFCWFALVCVVYVDFPLFASVYFVNLLLFVLVYFLTEIGIIWRNPSEWSRSDAANLMHPLKGRRQLWVCHWRKERNMHEEKMLFSTPWSLKGRC